MNRKNILLSLLGILSFAGLILSFLLIREYYGVSSGLCGTSGETSSCQTVANSAFSGIRNFPGLGDLPVALLGFSFYGALAYLVFRMFRAKTKEESELAVSNYVFVSLIGIVIDLLLFSVSVFLIKTICSLCFATYAITIAGTAIGLYLYSNSNQGRQHLFSNFQKEFLNIVLAFTVFFTVGHISSRATSPGNSSLISGSEKDPESTAYKIAQYDKAPNLNINTSGSPFLGDPNAPITIIKYADFNCGHCMHASHVLTKILAEYNGIVKIVYRNFPLDGNCNKLVQRKNPEASSCVAASASLCANEQGKFKEMYSSLYADNEMGVMHTGTTIRNIASKIGLNLPAFQSCMGSERPLNQIRKEVDEGGRLNIQGTPSIYLNDRTIGGGTPSEEFLKVLIEHVLKKS